MSIYQLIYKKVPMVLDIDFRGDYNMALPFIFQDPSDYYIDDLTCCSDKAVNDLVHELIGNNPMEMEDLIKLIIEIEQGKTEKAT
jgi:hypothetical protein